LSTFILQASPRASHIDIACFASVAAAGAESVTPVMSNNGATAVMIAIRIATSMVER